MGFSSVTLEGKEAHEALLSRQDSEIRLLELMRRCLVMKVKHDKDYASALSTVASQGQKVEKLEDMKESNVLKAWKVLMEELENLGKLFKSNADTIEKKTLDKLNTIYNEKRKAKKHYQDEYNRLCQQFSNLSEEVMKKKNDYCRYLDDYRLLRSRFEKQYFEFGRSGKDVREKCQKACRKLHQVHNEYVLLIGDAQETRQDFNTILLPCLLEQQQSIFQDLMCTWQTLLKELVQCWNVPAAQFTECCNNAENAINNIKPPLEYKMLIDEQNSNVTNPTNENEDFTFDNRLVEDTTGKLLPNQLTVDNLTVEWLKKKTVELEMTLKECQSSLNASKENSLPAAAHNLTMSELRSKERKLIRQIEAIRKALSDTGCEELPNGCDLDNSFEQNSDIQPLNRCLKRASLSSLHQHSTSVSPTSQISIVDKLWKPFRRKSAPNSPEMETRSVHGSANEQPSSGVRAHCPCPCPYTLAYL